MPNREFTNFILDIRTNRLYLDKVKAFIEANNNLEVLNTVTEEGENALYAAVCGANGNRRYDVLNYLLTIPGIDVNKSLTQSGDTPLIEAVLDSNDEAVKLLLAAEKIDVNKCNIKGETPALLAVRFGSDAIFASLSQHPKIIINPYELIRCAVIHRQISLLMPLLHIDNIDYSFIDDNGNTLLHSMLQVKCQLNATYRLDYINTIKMLVEKEKLDVNLQNNDKNTPFMFALSYQDTELINYFYPLFNKDYAARGAGNKSYLELTLLNKLYEPFEEALNTTDLNDISEDGLASRLYEIAYKAKNRKLIKSIVKNADKIKIVLSNSGTPLIQAVIDRDVEMVALLLAQPNHAINARDNDGCCALSYIFMEPSKRYEGYKFHLAVALNRLDDVDKEIFDLLMQTSGIDVNISVDNKSLLAHTLENVIKFELTDDEENVYSINKNYYDAFLKILKSPGVDINYRPSKKLNYTIPPEKNILMKAFFKNNLPSEIIPLIMQMGFNPRSLYQNYINASQQNSVLVPTSAPDENTFFYISHHNYLADNNIEDASFNNLMEEIGSIDSDSNDEDDENNAIEPHTGIPKIKRQYERTEIHCAVEYAKNTQHKNMLAVYQSISAKFNASVHSTDFDIIERANGKKRAQPHSISANASSARASSANEMTTAEYERICRFFDTELLSMIADLTFISTQIKAFYTGAHFSNMIFEVAILISTYFSTDRVNEVADYYSYILKKLASALGHARATNQIERYQMPLRPDLATAERLAAEMATTTSESESANIDNLNTKPRDIDSLVAKQGLNMFNLDAPTTFDTGCYPTILGDTEVSNYEEDPDLLLPKYIFNLNQFWIHREITSSTEFKSTRLISKNPELFSELISLTYASIEHSINSILFNKEIISALSIDISLLIEFFNHLSVLFQHIQKNESISQNPQLLFALQEANTYHPHFINSLMQDSAQDGTSLPVILASSEKNNINTSMAAAAAPSTVTLSHKN